jgi:hypothetical protein
MEAGSFKLYIVLTLIILLCGCAASGNKFSGLESLKGNDALVYIYRPSKSYGMAAAPSVFINNKNMHNTLRNGGFVQYSLSPGKHKLKLGSESFLTIWRKDIEWEVDLRPNERFFYRLDMDFGWIVPIGHIVFSSSSTRVVEVLDGRAKSEMYNLNSSM